MRLRKERDKKQTKNKKTITWIKDKLLFFFNLQSCDKFINAPTLISSNAHKYFTDLMAD